MAPNREAVVIGGGISGLACAYRLRQLGSSVTLLEATERAGGLIGSVQQNGFLFESGPQSFLSSETLLELIHDLGLADELLQADPQAHRYVLIRNRLQIVPMSPNSLLTSPLLSVRSRIRIVTEALGRTRPPGPEESVASFVRRKFGHEILEYLVTPFVSGVYAGDPEKLSLRSAFPSLAEWEEKYGSVVRGAIKSRPASSAPRPALCTFRKGMNTFLTRLSQALGQNFQTRAGVKALRRASNGPAPNFELRIARGSGEERMTAAAVVFAIPAYAAAGLLKGFSPRLATFLNGIAYAPVAVIAHGFDRRQIGNPLQGFGFLVPRREKVRVLGTVWNSSLFPGRSPNSMVAMTSFAGGVMDPAIVEMDCDSIASIIENEISEILGITGPPVERAVWRHPKALPQYNLGHAQAMTAIREELSQIPGLFLAGNYREGPSIGHCVEQASQTADAVHAWLTTNK